MTGASGVLLVDKPVGPTSFDVVRHVRRGYGRRVGHAGTLDPFASGLLLVLMGQATRLSQLMLGLTKGIRADGAVRRGLLAPATPQGEITSTGGARLCVTVQRALDGFRGLIWQKVPLTSAVKVDGEPLYRRAHRRGDR